MVNSLKVQSLKKYIAGNMNVIVFGAHGVGKTAKLQAACEELGLRMKYYSASTLDPYTDLVGVPVPNKDNRTVEYYRPHDIDSAEVIFFDEVNRADPKTINTIFEITQFHTINGEPLPNLKCVVAAANPVSEKYTTEELDEAFMDRFDVFLQADPEIDPAYFVKKFGDRLAAAAVGLWQEYEASRLKSLNSGNGELPYISPRRMDKIVAAFQLIPERQTLVDTFPPDVQDTSLIGNFHRTLSAAAKPVTLPGDDPSRIARSIIMRSVREQGEPEVGAQVELLLAHPQLKSEDREALLQSIASSLKERKTVDYIMNNFGAAVRAMKPAHRSILTEGWSESKKSSLKAAIGQ